MEQQNIINEALRCYKSNHPDVRERDCFCLELSKNHTIYIYLFLSGQIPIPFKIVSHIAIVISVKIITTQFFSFYAYRSALNYTKVLCWTQTTRRCRSRSVPRPPAASRDTLITFNLVKHEQRMKEWKRRESPKKKSQNTVLKKWERQVEYFNITRR